MRHDGAWASSQRDCRGARRIGLETAGRCASGAGRDDAWPRGGFASAAVAALLVLACAAPALAQEAIYIVRHAERVNDAPQSRLSPDGHARAARLAEILRDAGITAVFVTEYDRTVETAQPTAAPLGLTPVVHRADDTPGLIARVRALGPSARVLIAGHSDTVPKILAALGFTTPVTIAKAEYDNLFVVLPRKPPDAPVVLRLRY